MHSKPQEKRLKNSLHGFINLRKPKGISSNHALSALKRALSPQKCGHGGTLDPLAEGVLPVALGDATKLLETLLNAKKQYQFTVHFGQSTETDDKEGIIIQENDKRPTLESFKKAILAYKGASLQQPPSFSALKVNGKRAYQLARNGEQVTLEKRAIHIFSLELESFKEEEATLLCTCSKGTYIRVLARELAEHTGCLGYVSFLSRTQVGDFSLEKSVALEDVGTHSILPLEFLLPQKPKKNLSFLELQELLQGRSILNQDRVQGSALALFEGKLSAFLEGRGDKFYPTRVFSTYIKTYAPQKLDL